MELEYGVSVRFPAIAGKRTANVEFIMALRNMKYMEFKFISLKEFIKSPRDLMSRGGGNTLDTRNNDHSFLAAPVCRRLISPHEAD